MAKRYQRSNQKPYIEEEQTAQWPKDTRGVTRIRISKKNRQHNGQKKKYKRTNNDLQNIHINLKIE
jgi:predicted YcjX-like family ATPase